MSGKRTFWTYSIVHFETLREDPVDCCEALSTWQVWSTADKAIDAAIRDFYEQTSYGFSDDELTLEQFRDALVWTTEPQCDGDGTALVDEPPTYVTWYDGNEWRMIVHPVTLVD